MTDGLFSFAYGLKCLGSVKFCNILVNSKSELFSNQAISVTFLQVFNMLTGSDQL